MVLGGVYWYAETYGLYLGYPPFTPIYLWDYTGERTFDLTLRGAGDSLKVKVEGELKKGRMKVWVTRKNRRVVRSRVFTGKFEESFKWKLPPDRYQVHFGFEDARGWVRLDWVATKFEGW